MTPLPVAFYAPLKPPDHPTASGDRTMARLFMAALKEAGFDPVVVSRLRTFEPYGDEARQRELHEESEREADRLAATLSTLPPRHRPRLWFTYHNYYKAPDYLGPAAVKRLDLPYAIAEGSRAGKRADGPWGFAHRAAETALDAAGTVFVLTRQDRESLLRSAPEGQRLVDMPPFLDLRGLAAFGKRGRSQDGPARLLAVAMMRPGDKLQSYRLLAAGLHLVSSLPWTLDVVGDGPARADVESLFAPFGTRIALHGALEGSALFERYAEADLLVWPAVNEAYGMVLLEAQAMGCPVVAGAFGGVADALKPGVTGLMPPAGDVPAFADSVASLVADRERRVGMGVEARRFVADERDLVRAAEILNDALRPRLAAAAA